MRPVLTKSDSTRLQDTRSTTRAAPGRRRLYRVDFDFTGPVASFDSADGYRAMAREAGRAVTRLVG